MDEQYFKQEGPFYPLDKYRMDSWKRAVQEIINDMIIDVLRYNKSARDPFLLTRWFKEKWKQQLSRDWFRHETSYYLWLVHVSGLLLPLLEQETGCFKGLIQYSKSPKARSFQCFMLPIIKESDTWKLYVFEKEPHFLAGTVHAVTNMARVSSGPLPRSIQVYSIEDGRSSILQKPLYE